MSTISYQYESINYLCMPPPSNYYNKDMTSDHNSTTEDQDQEQEKRNKLIEQATNRLRQKILEKKYETLMSQIVEIQSKLDIIKLETQISFKSLNSNHLDHFEKRLENHKFELKNMIEKKELLSSPKEEKDDKSSSSSTTNSSLSTFSSILSSLKQKDEDYFVNMGQKKKRRSRRQSSSRQPQQQQQQQQQQSSQQDDDGTVSEIGRNNNELIVLHSIQHSSRSSSSSSSSNHGVIKYDSSSLLEKRNALDDTLSFLNGLASDTDDGGFRKDIIDLLNLHHPIKSSTQTTTTTTHHHHCFFIKNPLSHLFVTSWKWIRFALIMTLAILINLKQGPSLF
ncbi:hypothetical protein BD770DRAFT_376453 [Pilaira anomala]|nr:hypothetical protein BD770DRAFT_376453 [Pilaira anomala]